MYLSMRRSRSSHSGKLAFTLLLIILAAGTAALANRSARAAVSTPTPPAQVWGHTPLRFEAKLGQTDTAVDYLSRGPGYVAFINSSGATLSLHKHNAESAEALRMTLVGADRNVRPGGEDQLTAKANYLVGNDSAQWKT